MNYFAVQFDDMPLLQVEAVEFYERYFVPHNPFRPEDPQGTLPPEPYIRRQDVHVHLKRGTVVASTRPGEAVVALPEVGRYEPYHVQLFVQGDVVHEVEGVVSNIEQGPDGYTLTVTDEQARV